MVASFKGRDFIASAFSLMPVGMVGQSDPKITLWASFSSSGKYLSRFFGGRPVISR